MFTIYFPPLHHLSPSSFHLQKSWYTSEPLWPFTPSHCLTVMSHHSRLSISRTFSKISLDGKECGGCFVASTWKCFFYSASCFGRPFVRSVRVCMHKLTFFNFCIISVSFQSFPSLFSALLSCAGKVRACVCVKNDLFVAVDGAGNVSLAAGVYVLYVIGNWVAISSFFWGHTSWCCWSGKTNQTQMDGTWKWALFFFFKKSFNIT